MDAEEKLQQVIVVLDQLAEDTSVPRNIRRGASECKTRLLKRDEALDVRTASVVMVLDDLGNDPNIPQHAYVLILNIIAQLEQIK